MLLRAVIACLVVFGAFAVAAWVVAPNGGWSVAFNASRQDPQAKPQPVPAAPPPVAAEAVPQTRTVRTLTFRRPDNPDPSAQPVDTALLSPQPTVAPPPPAPALPPPAPRSARPFRCPSGTPTAAGPPTVAQIGQIGEALKLSPEQERHWRPVEKALLDIARHFEGGTGDPQRGKTLLSVERMQQIYWMAGPLVLSLREEQKRDARTLACSMGLGAVAALI